MLPEKVFHALFVAVTGCAYWIFILAITSSNAGDDLTQTRFGVRKTEFDSEKGFLLNGRYIKVKGMCNHQDFGGIGTAVPEAISAFRIKKLKSLGACLLYTSPSPRDQRGSRMPSSA